MTKHETDRPLFGAMAVALGFVGPEAVELALRQQEAERRGGAESQRIGELLVRMNALSREQQSVVTRALPRTAPPPRQARRRPNPAPIPRPTRPMLPLRPARPSAEEQIAALRAENARLRAELDLLTDAMIDKEDLIASLRDSLEALAVRRAPPRRRFHAA